MSTTTSPRRAAGTVPAAPRAAAPRVADLPAVREDLDEMRHRGVTVIAERVFEKIGGQAASEVSTSRGRSGGVFGFGAEADADALPKADVDLSADSVDIDLAIGITYPGSVRAAAQEIRDHVSTTVHALTGVPVHRVDIDVTFLAPTSPSTPGATGPAGHRRRKEKLR